jgi:glycyl-tRNA synthetase beta chain
LQGEHADVSGAIADQYKPPEEIEANAPISGLLSLADKIDLIVSFFSIGKSPTGSKDPFALRRAAIGLIKIIVKFNLSLNLKNVLEKALENLAPPISEQQCNIIADVMDFILDRLKIIMADGENVRPEMVAAVASQRHDLLSIWRTAKIIDAIIKSDTGARVVMAYRRAKNILDSCIDDQEQTARIELKNDPETIIIKQELLQEMGEKRLADAINSLDQQLKIVDSGTGDACEKMQQKFKLCLDIEQPVADFFTNVMVNAPVPDIRHNRLMLLQKLVVILNSVLPFHQFYK